MKELTVIFFCTFKFAATFPLALYGYNMSMGRTLLFTNIGGAMGTIGFMLIWAYALQAWNKFYDKRLSYRKKEKKRFTKKTRRIVRIRTKYGMPGIVFLNPLILSLPVGAFLVVKYYGFKKRYALWLIAGQVGWSFIYTLFYYHARELFI